MNKKKQTCNKQPGSHRPEGKRPKRKRGGWIVFGIVFVCAAVLLALLPTLAERGREMPRSIVCAEAAPAVIEENIRAAGTLLDEDASYLSVPEGVRYEFVKENGDMVAPGELIATTDTTSVMLTIQELQSAMEELDEKIEDARDGSSSATLLSPADGRVKAIYAESGKSVSDTMYENGALILLSLDGKMAVDVAASSVSAGQALTVEFSDGSTADGRVSAIAGSRATVTISDDGPAPGEAVALRDEHGQLLGSGSLYIHSELKITGYYGTVDSLSVSLNEYIYEDESLLSLSIEDNSAAYAGLLAQRQEMERQMQSLFQLYQDGGLYAQEGGFLTELVEYTDPDEEESQTQTGGFLGGGMPFGLAAEAEAPRLMLLSDTPEAIHPVGSASKSLEAPFPEENIAIPEPEAPDPSSDSPIGESPLSPVPDGSLPPPPDTPAGGSSTAFLDRYAKVISVAADKLLLSMAPNAAGIHYADRNSIASLSYSQESSVYLPALSTVLIYSGSQWSLGSLDDLKPGDYIVLTYAGSHDTAPLLWIVLHPAQDSSSPGGKPEGGKPENEPSDDPKPEVTPSPSPSPENSQSSGEMGGMSGMGGFNMSGLNANSFLPNGMTMPEGMVMAQEEKYLLSERQVCAITPDSSMTVELAIDELDILALSEGQEVVLHLPALDRDFIGSIQEIAAEASANGGSPKFLVTVRVTRDLDMRTGMNAAARIVLSRTEAPCTLPVEALTDRDGKSYVYTAYDESADELLLAVAVETGRSDGQTVEIVSGLAPGALVYYEYQESLLSPLFE